MTEPRFLLIDTDTGKRVALTTDEVQAALFRIELQQPGDGAYFEKQGDDNGGKRDGRYCKNHHGQCG